MLIIFLGIEVHVTQFVNPSKFFVRPKSCDAIFAEVQRELETFINNDGKIPTAVQNGMLFKF